MKTEKKTINKKSLKIGLIGATILTIIVAFFYVYIFGIDPFALFGFFPAVVSSFVVSFGFVWSASVLYLSLAKTKMLKSKKLTIVTLIVFIVAVIIIIKITYFSIPLVKNTLFDKKLYYTSDPETLAALYPKALELAIKNEDTQALKNIAVNPATPENLLYEIYKEATTAKIPDREERLNTLYFLAINSATPT